MIAIKLHPESKTSTIPAPKGAIGEVVAKRRASQKCWQMPNGKQVIYCWNKYAPVHYLDDYSEGAKQAWKEIDPTYYEDMGDHLLFNRMPHTVKVFKNKPGYEITDRQTGKTMSVELLELDDEPLDKSSKSALVTFEAEVRHNGVRLWKESAPGGPTKFKWRIKESVGESRLKFRDVPEAFDLTKLPAGLEAASDEDKEEAKVGVAVLKTPLADGFDWTEQVDRTGVKIDTDITGSTSDGFIYGENATYSTARSTSTYCDSTTYYIAVGQLWDSTVDYQIIRGFLDFSTSGISGTVTQVNLKLTCVGNYSTTDFDVQIVKQTWSESLCTNRETNFDGCLSGTAETNIWRNTSGIVTNTPYTSGNLDTSRINKTGDTKYSLRSGRDKISVVPTGNEWLKLASASNGTSGYRPVLIVAISIDSPTVTTSSCDQVTYNSARGNGNITATGGESVTRRGFCYMTGTSGDPTTANSVKYEDGTFSTGTFSLTIDGLSAGTNYRVRAYAVNSAGTGYGTTVQLTTTTGWTGKIWGVENPASIWGIDVANIAKVHGL